MLSTQEYGLRMRILVYPTYRAAYIASIYLTLGDST
jgi:hypothetical protein